MRPGPLARRRWADAALDDDALVIDLLTRLGADHDAAVLHGAVTERPTAPPAFGVDAERLQANLHTLAHRLGPEQLAAARDQGAELHDDAAVAAVAAIDDATAHDSADPGQPKSG